MIDQKQGCSEADNDICLYKHIIWDSELLLDYNGMVGYAINIFSQAAATYRKEAVVLHMFRDVDKIL